MLRVFEIISNLESKSVIVGIYVFYVIFDGYSDMFIFVILLVICGGYIIFWKWMVDRKNGV